MSDEISVLTQLGIKLSDVVAGLAGGMVNALVFKASNPMSIVASMIVGAFTANYLGEIAAKTVGMSNGASSFIVGLGGMAVCQAIVEAMRKWRPPVPGGDTNVKP